MSQVRSAALHQVSASQMTAAQAVLAGTAGLSSAESTSVDHDYALGLKHKHEADTYGALLLNGSSMEYALTWYRSDVAIPTDFVTNEIFDQAHTSVNYNTAALPSHNGPISNGSGDLTASVAASSNQGINGLLSGVRWADGSITYSDPDSPSDYQAGHPEPFTNFQQLSASQMSAVHSALTQTLGFSVTGFTNLNISYAGAGSGAGTIRVANTSDPGTAYAYYPSNGSWGGDVFFGPSGSAPVQGNYHWHTVIHELGHALGLKHGQETSVYGAMPSNIDSMEYSVMTYRSYIGAPLSGYTNESFGYAQTFMMYDIAALQYMYGADFTINSGNTTYKWSPTSGNTLVNGQIAIQPGANRIFATIWDGNGIDTYDLSAYTTNLNINLNPGGHSVFSAAQLADLDGFSTDPARVARGNIFNALQFNGDARSLIENATGGSGKDVIIGNQAGNTLTGGTGDDSLTGHAGIDKLLGGIGSDWSYGGLGKDTHTGGTGNDSFRFASASEGGDIITDFKNVSGDNDLFRITASGFGGGLVAGKTLSSSQFQTRNDNLAQDSDDRFIFRTTDHTLWFDSNGNVSGGLTLLADLQAGATVTSADILLVA